MQFNIHQAKSQLSKLIAMAEQGEEVVIARAGTPVVKLVMASPKKRVPGAAKGKIWMAENFAEPMTESELAEFLGE